MNAPAVSIMPEYVIMGGMAKMGEPARVLDERFTYRDYLTWPDDERWELIDGVAYEMSPSPSWKHQGLLLELGHQLKNHLEGKPCRVFIAPLDVLLFAPDQGSDAKDEDIDTVVQPDALVICDKGKLGKREIRGAPDIAVEILSPYSWARDTRIKLAAYEKRGVKEYWIVDPGNRVVNIFKRPDAKGFGPAESVVLDADGVTGSFSSAVLPDFQLDFRALFAAAEL
ncbi:MAG TPA: Uma2 family endonuclease [Treponema sp.]|nr:Uma2 family endonuclease [Treponema sp.]